MDSRIIIIPLIAIALCAAIAGILILLIHVLKKHTGSADARREETETKKTLGAVLKSCRTDCGMTQEYVAERLGVSRQAVSKWESGTSDPSTSNLLSLAKLYSVSADDILKRIR